VVALSVAIAVLGAYAKLDLAQGVSAARGKASGAVDQEIAVWYSGEMRREEVMRRCVRTNRS